MCTAVLSISPGLTTLLAGIRDELTDRAWEPPARHWPEYPGLVGGRDLLAGGTWLAVAPREQRVACVLNGRGTMAPERSRLSRGVLPLRTAAGYELDRSRLAGFDPFHLLTAEPGRAALQSWDGARLTERELGPGLHFVVNSGLASDLAGTGAHALGRPDQPGRPENPTQPEELGQPERPGQPERLGQPEAQAPNGRDHELARIAWFLPRFGAAARPVPQPGDQVSRAWGAWLPLVDGDGLDRDDPAALIVRRDLGGGRTWGTTSISLVAISPANVRYDFTGEPGDPAGWQQVGTGV